MIGLLIALGIGASFIGFTVCLWLIKREQAKKKNLAPPKLPRSERIPGVIADAFPKQVAAIFYSGRGGSRRKIISHRAFTKSGRASRMFPLRRN